MTPLSEAKLFKPRAAFSHRPLVSKLLKSLGEYIEPPALEEIGEACDFGVEAHKGQKRQSGEPYISHPVAVAGILGDMRMDSRTIIAAILHDVIEDTPITVQQLAEKFGEDVAHLVDGVSKVSQLETESRESAEVASFRKMFMAMAEDIRVIIIKLCDRLHNMRTLGHLREEKRHRISRQTLDIYGPIASRLGIRELANTLEDLAFQNLYPRRYKTIAQMLRTGKRGRKSVIDEVCAQLDNALRNHGITSEVVGREKNIYSIYRKALKKPKINLRGVQDVNGFRVITANRDTCYLALGIIHKQYNPIHSRFKDYIAIPKTNGYQSLHTTVLGPSGQHVEIQIRCHSMHRIAETGVASHWIYKTENSDDSAPQQLAQKWLSSFIESPQMTGDPGDFIEHLKADLYPDEVYVFTPKSEIKQLPRGATALDFAYAVHSDVGNRCIAAKINGVEIPLHEKLNNGDHVEIKISPRAMPRPSWLNYAVTSKARSAIRQFLNKQKAKDSVKLGQKLLKKALWDEGYRNPFIPSRHKITLLEALDLKDWPELLADIGFGKRLAPLVAKQFVSEVMGPSESMASRKTATAKKNYGKMTIEGTEGLMVSYAKCCYPIPNDRIIGTTTADRGLVIHRLRCSNARGIMKHPDQFFHLNWSANTRGTFKTQLRLEAQDETGVLSEITKIIASHKANVNKLNVEELAGNISRMTFVIEVTDRKHLADIMREIHMGAKIVKLVRMR